MTRWGGGCKEIQDLKKAVGGDIMFQVGGGVCTGYRIYDPTEKDDNKFSMLRRPSYPILPPPIHPKQT